MKRFSILFLAIVAVALMIGLGCKKTTEYEKRPYTDIESFVVKGYAADSISASINNNDIIIYWASEVAAPATITPTIAVATGATISPASGTAVDFNSNTVYTVTAEDGTVKKYNLKPVINKPIPRIATISPGSSMVWISSTWLTITGEYFLVGDTSDVHVYMERMRDGFEFDLVLDYTKLTMTSIYANLPAYTNDMDTGMHKLRVKIGNRTSEEKEVNLHFPDITYTGMAQMSWVEAGQTLKAGDSMTLKITDNYNGNVLKWYAKKFTKLVFENYSFDSTQMKQTDSTVKIRIPDTPINKQPSNVAIYYTGNYGSQNYWAKILGTAAFPIIPVKQ
jgi:hypothetical protein